MSLRRYLVPSLLAVATACGSGTAPAPAPTPSLQSLDIGTTGHTARGNDVTLLAFTFPYGKQRPPGKRLRFATADIRACVPATAAAPADVELTQFRLVVDNVPLSPAKQQPRTPRLPVGRLPAGHCARGWVAFPVPENLHPTVLLLVGSGGVAWRIP
jgi:hypothetical protein